jgi:hypothetical protein
VFNSSTVNYTRAVETEKYLFLMEENKPLHVIPKESDYAAMKADWKESEGKIADVVIRNYDSDFSTVEDGKVFALKDNDMVDYSLIPLELSYLKMECRPLTSLMSYWWGEDIEKFEFKILGRSNEPEYHFTFNVYNVYLLGTTGTIFWVWIWVNISAVILIMVFRMIRLGCKRKAQMKRMDGFKKMSIVGDASNNPLNEYQQELEASSIPALANKRESMKSGTGNVEMSPRNESKTEGESGNK